MSMMEAHSTMLTSQSPRDMIYAGREVCFRLEDHKRSGDVTFKSTRKHSSKCSGSRKSSFESKLEKLKAKEVENLAQLRLERMRLKIQYELETERKMCSLKSEIKMRRAEVQKLMEKRKQKKLEVRRGSGKSDKKKGVV